MAVRTEIKEITPSEAMKMLEGNTENRNVRQRAVQTLMRDMKAGRWRLNGESIKLNGSGTVIDGQHRLLACVLAEKPFTTMVVYGLTEADHPTIDVGMARTFSDELRFRNEINVADLAAVTSLTWKYDNSSLTTGLAPSRGELLAHLRKNPGLRESIKARKIGNDLVIRGTALQATYFLIHREHGEQVADVFLHHLTRGVDYVQGDPCLALRNYALHVATRPTIRPNTTEWLAVCIKAANGFLTGSLVRSLRWRRLGPQREKFPVLVTADEAIDILNDYANDLS